MILESRLAGQTPEAFLASGRNLLQVDSALNQLHELVTHGPQPDENYSRKGVQKLKLVPTNAKNKRLLYKQIDNL